jgi:MFS family permease
MVANLNSTRFLWALGLPAFALSLASTTVSGLLPVVLSESAGPAGTGALVALEGVFAILVPLAIGPWSDRIGARLPFVAFAGLLGTVALVLMALGGPLAVLAIWIALFQVAYFTYMTAYFALYPDLVDDEHSGRAQGAAGSWRGIGLGLAFVGGPALLAVWRGGPFLLAAVVMVVVTPAFGLIVRRRLERHGAGEENVVSSSGPRKLGPSADVTGVGSVRRLLRVPELRWFVVCNALWEAALAALRAFVVLFLTVGLDKPTEFASLALGLVVVAALIAAPLSGWLGDRFGTRRVLVVSLLVYGFGLLAPAFSQAVWLMPVVLAGGVAAVTVMTLPFALLMEMLPPRDHGAASALFGVSRGLGLLGGPLVAGACIALFDGVFDDTKGYGVIFVVASACVLATVPMLSRLATGERADAE